MLFKSFLKAKADNPVFNLSQKWGLIYTGVVSKHSPNNMTHSKSILLITLAYWSAVHCIYRCYSPYTDCKLHPSRKKGTKWSIYRLEVPWPIIQRSRLSLTRMYRFPGFSTVLYCRMRISHIHWLLDSSCTLWVIWLSIYIYMTWFVFLAWETYISIRLLYRSPQFV